MKTNRISLTLSLAVAPLAVAPLSPPADARPPRAASATVTRTGPMGNSSVRQSNVATNGQGGYTAGSTFTGPAGNVTTRQQSGSYNPATKTYTRTGTTTLPNGQQSNFSTLVQATGDGLARSATGTAPAGNSVNTQGQASYNPSTGTLTQGRT